MTQSTQMIFPEYEVWVLNPEELDLEIWDKTAVEDESW
jgi:hypothetical protein